MNLADPKRFLMKYQSIEGLTELQKMDTLFQLALTMKGVAKVDPENFFGDNLYVRKVKLKKGHLVIGTIHKFDHVVIMVEGDMTLWTSDGFLKRVKAPFVMESKAGSRRVAIIHEDVLFVNAHGIPNEQLNELSGEDPFYDYLTCDTSDAYLEYLRGDSIESTSMKLLDSVPRLASF